jgi:hypothetical protein
MRALRRIARPCAYTILASFLALSLHLPAAQAALVGTDVVISAAKKDEVRAKLGALLARDDVQQALAARGVGAAELRARVAALTDEEAARLSAQLDELPAGGDSVLGIAVFVFLVLLFTDILCFTDIFPFVKKGHCRR